MEATPALGSMSRPLEEPLERPEKLHLLQPEALGEPTAWKPGPPADRGPLVRLEVLWLTPPVGGRRAAVVVVASQRGIQLLPEALEARHLVGTPQPLDSLPEGLSMEALVKPRRRMLRISQGTAVAVAVAGTQRVGPVEPAARARTMARAAAVEAEVSMAPTLEPEVREPQVLSLLFPTSKKLSE